MPTGKLTSQKLLYSQQQESPWRQSIAHPLRLSLPVAWLFLPLGGVLAILWASYGIPFYWILLSALIIYAGSMEFFLVSFIVTEASLLTIAWATLLVNFRHVFYGLTFPYKRLHTPWQRGYGIFSLTDEVYAVTAVGEGSRLSGRELTVFGILCQGWWVGGTFLGIVAASWIPENVSGFDFSLTVMFTILTLDAFRETPASLRLKIILCTLGSLAIGAIAARIIVQEGFLAFSMLAYVFMLIAVFYRPNRTDVGKAD